MYVTFGFILMHNFFNGLIFLSVISLLTGCQKGQLAYRKPAPASEKDFLKKQKGQHPLTGQHTANFRRDLEAT